VCGCLGGREGRGERGERGECGECGERGESGVGGVRWDGWWREGLHVIVDDECSHSSHSSPTPKRIPARRRCCFFHFRCVCVAASSCMWMSTCFCRFFFSCGFPGTVLSTKS